MFLGSEKIYPVELQERARLHFPYTSSTYYHVESVLQKRLKRQDHPLLIVSISISHFCFVHESDIQHHSVPFDARLIFLKILLHFHLNSQ